MTPASTTFWNIVELVEMVCCDMSLRQLSQLASVSRAFYTVPGGIIWGLCHSRFIEKALLHFETDPLTAEDEKRMFLLRITPFVKSFKLVLDGRRPLALPRSLPEVNGCLFPNVRNVMLDIDITSQANVPISLLQRILTPGIRQLSILARGFQPEALRTELKSVVSRLPALCPTLTHLSLVWDAPYIPGSPRVVNANQEGFVDWDAVSSLPCLNTLEVERLPRPEIRASRQPVTMESLVTLVVCQTDLASLPDFVHHMGAANVRHLCARGVHNRLPESDYKSLFQSLPTALPKLKTLELLVHRVWYEPCRKTAAAFQPLAHHPNLQTLTMPGNTYLRDQAKEELEKLRELLPRVRIAVDWDEFLNPFILTYY